MKLRRVITALVLTIYTITSSAYAAVIDTAVYNSDTDTITLKGTLPKSKTLATFDTTNTIVDSTTIQENKWAVTGAWSSSESKNVYTIEKLNDDPSCANGYIKLSNRPNDYTTIAQRVHTFLSDNDCGKYIIEGKIKTGSTTPQTITMHLVKDYTAGTQKDNASTPDVNESYYNQNYYNHKIENVANEWVSFRAVFDISDYGTDKSGNAWDHFPSSTEGNGTKTVARNCSIDFYTDSTSKAKLADVYYADIKMSKIEEYDNPEKIGVTISNSDGIVYANEIETEEEYSYKAALQLKDGTSAENLTANVYNPSSKEITSLAVTTSSNRDTVSALKTDKTVNVSFDLFDFIDTRDLKSLSLLAVNYKEGILTGSTVVPCEITQSTLVNQNISVGGDADQTKLFLLANADTIIPLTGVHTVETYTNSEPTLFLIGDSICVEYTTDDYYPQQGWGVKVGNLFEGITVENCAHGGYSTETFLNYDSYQRGYAGAHTWNSETVVAATSVQKATPILPQIKKGDYVLVSLGINDGFNVDFSGVEDLNAGQTTAEKYKANLQKFIDDTRAKGAEIIFATPTANGLKEAASGVYNEDYKQRGDLMVEVANANNVVCLPLGAKMAEKYNGMTEDQVKANHMFWDTVQPLLKIDDYTTHKNTVISGSESDPDGMGNDTVHLTETGAQFIAELIAEMLEDSDSSLKYFLK